MKKIYILDAFHEAGVALAKAHAEVVCWPDPAIADWPEHADGVMVRMTPITAAQMERAQHVQVICKQGVGTDTIDLQAAKRHGIAVSRTPGVNSEAVAELAQRCLDTLTQVVYEFGGTIEKYSGDGLMAIWGAPRPDPQHAQHAIEAGITMQKNIEALETWFIAHDFKPMKVSVGVNTGEMAVGVFGGDAHLAWTAHGDAVNVASRIEQLTRSVNVDFLLGERTALLYGFEKLRYVGDYEVKGRQQSVVVYTLK